MLDVDQDPLEIVTWTHIGSGQDKLETRSVAWTSGHEDTLAAKGFVSTEQMLGIEEGKDPWMGVLETMWESGARGKPDKSADVAVAYDFLELKSLEVTTDYRGTT